MGLKRILKAFGLALVVIAMPGCKADAKREIPLSEVAKEIQARGYRSRLSPDAEWDAAIVAEAECLLNSWLA